MIFNISKVMAGRSLAFSSANTINRLFAPGKNFHRRNKSTLNEEVPAWANALQTEMHKMPAAIQSNLGGLMIALAGFQLASFTILFAGQNAKIDGQNAKIDGQNAKIDGQNVKIDSALKGKGPFHSHP